MGEALQSEVTRQLLADLEHYLPGLSLRMAHIDWSDATQEGHTTEHLGGVLESLSGISVLDSQKRQIASGWFDFVHGGDPNPLFVFWLFLDTHEHGQRRDAKSDKWIPQHVWDRLPESSRAVCTFRGRYDAEWCDDPAVVSWHLATSNRGLR